MYAAETEGSSRPRVCHTIIGRKDEGDSMKILIAFFVGELVGMVVMALMVASGRDR